MDERTRRQIRERLGMLDAAELAASPQLQEIANLLVRSGLVERDAAICQDPHPPCTGLAALSPMVSRPVATQILAGSVGTVAPQQQAEARIDFDTGGGLLIDWFADALDRENGGAYDGYTQGVAEVQLGINGREDLVTNGTVATWVAIPHLFTPGYRYPLVRIVGSSDTLNIRGRNTQPTGGTSTDIEIRHSFGFLAAADILAALARVGG